MKLPFSDWQFVFNPAHDRRLKLISLHETCDDTISKGRISSIEQKLGESMQKLGNALIYLAGGLGIVYTLKKYPEKTISEIIPVHVPCVVGGFYRDHDALDIECYVEDLEKLIAAARENSLVLFKRRGPLIKVSPSTKSEIYSPVSPEDLRRAAANPSESDAFYKNLRLIDISKVNKPNSVAKKSIPHFVSGDISSYINVYVHSYETQEGRKVRRLTPFTFHDENKREINYDNMQVRSYERGITVPAHYFKGCQYTLEPQKILLRIVNPVYLLKVKTSVLREKNKNDARHELDIEVLENMVSHIYPDLNIHELLRPQL